MTGALRSAAWSSIWLGLLLGAAFADDKPKPQAACDGKFGLCRYIDGKTKEELIPARFERALPFSEDLAAVRVDGRWGYVDIRGDMVITPRFDLAGDFYQGLAEVLVDNKAGVINRAGEMVVPPTFRRAVVLTKDVIIAVESKSTDRGRLESLPLFSFLHGPAGLYHVSGHWIHEPDLNFVSQFEKDGRGLIWARVEAREGGPFGLLASDGKWVVEPQYDDVMWLIDERAVVRKRVDGVMLSGAVDATGKIVVPLQTWNLRGWKNGWGWAWVTVQGGKEVLLDKSGNIIGGRYFDRVSASPKGDISTVRIDDRWFGIDRAGNILPYPDNGRIFASCPNGLQVLIVDGKLQVTDAKRQPTTPYLFDGRMQKPKCDRPFPVMAGGKGSYVTLDGRLLIDPPIFDYVRDFEDGYASVARDSKWGAIDTSGRVVFEPIYDMIIYGSSVGLFYAIKDGREIWMTPTGEERPAPQIPIKYTPKPETLDCKHGLKLIERDGRWGIADADGREVIPPRYRALSCFAGGIVQAPIDERRQWCALDREGKIREQCETSHYPTSVPHHFPESFDKDAFENSVLWNRAYLEFHAGKRDLPPGWVSDGGPYAWPAGKIIR